MIGFMSCRRPSVARTGVLLLALAIAGSMPISATGACVMTLLGDTAAAEACGQVCTMAQCPMHGQRMPEAPAQTHDPKCCQMSDAASVPAVALRPVTTVRTLPEPVVAIVPAVTGRRIDAASAPLRSLDPALDPRPPRTA
jgi:hypothetical protein